MEVIKKQRLAVCRILLDVVEGACEVRDPDLIMRTRHYPALQKEMCFADRDWEEARDLSVLACLVLSKELHYKVKMMIGLVAHDLYSRESLSLIHIFRLLILKGDQVFIDLYGRLDVQCPEGKELIEGRTQGLRVLSDLQNILEPVSYTHLDVYKRQVLIPHGHL